MTTMEAVALELASAESASSQPCVTAQALHRARQSRAMVCPPCEHREGRRDPLRPGPNPRPLRRAPSRHADAHALPVTVGRTSDDGSGRHEIAELDGKEGWAEIHLLLASRRRIGEGDISLAGLHCLEHVSALCVYDWLELD